MKSQIESLDADALLQTLDDVERWKNYRNEIMHSLLNKNMFSVEEEIAETAVRGMELARELDAHERMLKKGNVIRRSCGLKME